MRAWMRRRALPPPTGLMKLVMFCVAVLAIEGCNLPAKFSGFPSPLTDGAKVTDDMAVVIVGNDSAPSVNYLQFSHSAFPAINVGDCDVPSMGTIAISIPVGVKQLSLSDYTNTAHPGVTLATGMSLGYVRVDTPSIDMTEHGLYYLATITQFSPTKYALKPAPQLLLQFKHAYPELAKLKPINFSWT